LLPSSKRNRSRNEDTEDPIFRVSCNGNQDVATLCTVLCGREQKLLYDTTFNYSGRWLMRATGNVGLAFLYGDSSIGTVHNLRLPSSRFLDRLLAWDSEVQHFTWLNAHTSHLRTYLQSIRCFRLSYRYYSEIKLIILLPFPISLLCSISIQSSTWHRANFN